MSVKVLTAPTARSERAGSTRPSMVETDRRAGLEMVMTCDLMVADKVMVERRAARPATELCFPTGRPERRESRPNIRDRRSNKGVRSNASVIRSYDPAPVEFQLFDRVSNTRGAVTARSNTTAADAAAIYRRRRVVGALLVGGVLAAMVWMLAVVGASVADSATPATPAATEVVYVRAGESLTALAERIAPELPSNGVIAQVRALNGLETSGLSVGQALRVPTYK